MLRSVMVLVSVLTVGVSTSPVAHSSPGRCTFRAVFAGVAADGVSNTWEGPVDGAMRGRLALVLRQMEEPAAAAKPVWHVASQWTVRDRATGSLAATLEGMIDWKAGTLRLAGPVTEGPAKGAWMEVDARFNALDLEGTATISQAVANRTVSRPRLRE